MISICIPCYEMHGKGVQYLNILLDSIKEQTYQDYEIIISDHSRDDNIQNLVHQYEKTLYIRNEIKIGNSSSNINNAIKNSKGNIIKPMFQDDFFCNKNCLANIAIVGESRNWGAIGFNHVDGDSFNFYRSIMPRYNNRIITGVNTIGAPSVIFFKNDNNYFDENLIWLMDCEFYERLYRKYSYPVTIQDIGVTSRLWGNSVSNTVSEEIKNKEQKYIKSIYNV